jgi:hypothetical protein
MILTMMLTNAANRILTLNALIHSTKMASPQVIFFVKWVMKSVKCGEEAGGGFISLRSGKRLHLILKKRCISHLRSLKHGHKYCLHSLMN